jgi:hypothetical protein
MMGYVSDGEPETFENRREIVMRYNTLDKQIITVISCYAVAKTATSTRTGLTGKHSRKWCRNVFTPKLSRQNSFVWMDTW